MKSINGYLTFDGDCKEAFTFYQGILGGELNFQTIGESPMAQHMPPSMKDSILHATLVQDGHPILMGSDMVHQSGLIKGNASSMVLQFNSEEVVKVAYQNLSEGGVAKHPLEVTFWGALFGDLTDKYGHNWILNYEKSQSTNSDFSK